MVLDGIEDPHNVGAILRTVDAAGADGVVRQSRHAARLDGAAAKASAGAVAHVKIAEVVNIARAIEDLKEAGVWTVGLAGDAPKRYDEVDFTLPTAIVVGAEGTGLRRLVRERCDWLVVDSDGGARSEPECVGRDGHCPVRGGPTAARGQHNERFGTMNGCRTVAGSSVGRSPTRDLRRVAQDVLKFTFCLAGVAQSGRAADL